MSVFQRYRWLAAAAAITLGYAAVSLLAHPSAGLTAFADLAGLCLMLAACGIMLGNMMIRPRGERSFWVLMAAGLLLWGCNQAAWAYFEIVKHRRIPDPFFFDIILFFHAVPMIAAVVWRPDMLKKEKKIHLSLLNFSMLLGWWIFLYAFIVFPPQYVVLNVGLYDIYYDRLYLLQNVVLLAV